MKHAVWLILLLAVFSCKEEKAVESAEAEKLVYDIIIKKIGVIDGSGGELLFLSNIYVNDGQIIKIEKGAVKDDAKVLIDGSRKFAMPTIIEPGIFTIDSLLSLTSQGVTPIEAIHRATQLSAEQSGVSDTRGSLEADKLANIIILKESPLIDISKISEIEYIIEEGVVVTGPQAQ